MTQRLHSNSELTNMRSARQVVLLEVTVAEGDGEKMPVRECVYYFRPNGEMVASQDPLASGLPMTMTMKVER